MPVTPSAARIRWIAARDGLAHAHRSARAPRAVCGATAVPERLAWPEQRRCGACVAALEGQR